MNSDNRSESEILRRKAEEVLKEKSANAGSQLSEAETLRLIHELEVHQIELEMQNEALAQAKEQAEDATEKFASLYDFAPSGYFTLSREGDIMEINLTGAKMLGKERNHLKKARFGFFISDDTLPVFNLFLDQVFINQGTEICEVALTGNGDLIRYVHLTGIAAENREQCLVTMIDFTGIKQAKEELLRSENAKSAILKAIPDMLFVFDPNGNYLEVVAVDESELLMPQEALKGKNISDLFPPDIAGRAIAALKQSLFRNELVEFSYSINISGKTEFYEARIVPASKDTVLTIVRNITRGKLAEQEIEFQKERLFKLNAEKDRFYSILAHDLRGPFNGLLGLSRILVEQLPELSPAEIQKIALSMAKSATNYYSMLESLLEWGRIQSGRTSYDPELFLLMPKIEDYFWFVMDAANKKDIAISFEIPEGLTVFADANMLGSVIRNLASNAVKFTPKGGKITISAKPETGNRVEIANRDNGIGMPEEMLDKLFLLDGNTRRNGTDGEPSTGLGLIICKDLIEKNGGKIRVESKKGKGSTFYVTFPNNKVL